MKRVRIIKDSDPLNPRTEFDCHSGRMVCWHSKYNLGDEHSYDCDEFLQELAFEACEGLEAKVWELENELYNELYDRAVGKGSDDPNEYAGSRVGVKVDDLIECALRTYVILPLYLHDHSGITMSTGPFSCPFDSGQVGYIVCDNETIHRDFNSDMELAEKSLEAEVALYDQYLSGDVYGFIVEEKVCDDCDTWKEIDSCWGFFGSDVRTNGMEEHLGSDDLVELAACADIEYPSY